MKSSTIGRREVITGAVSYGMLAAAFGARPAPGFAADTSAQGTTCLTILYAAGPGLHFDPDYYRDHHLVTIMKLYGSTISRFELRTVNTPPAPAGANASSPPQTPPGGAPPPPRYAAAINIWIADLDAFNDNNKKHGATLVKDVPNFTNAMATIQYDKLHGQMGAGRSAVKLGDTCLTILYPNSDGVRWDVDYYRTGHMPLIMRLYGPQAIKRFELRKGDTSQNGGKPAYIGSVNIYVNNQKAFDAAGKAHGQELVKDVPHFSSVQPFAYPTTVYGIG
jgi:uncharacterized protein (TIGR02118 family)